MSLSEVLSVLHSHPYTSGTHVSLGFCTLVILMQMRSVPKPIKGSVRRAVLTAALPDTTVLRPPLRNLNGVGTMTKRHCSLKNAF